MCLPLVPRIDFGANLRYYLAMETGEDLEKKVDETLEMVKENNKILKKMRSRMMWSSVVRVIYWIIILAAAFGAYYVIKPVVDDVREAYDGVVDSINSVKEVGQKFTDPFHRNSATTTRD